MHAIPNYHLLDISLLYFCFQIVLTLQREHEDVSPMNPLHILVPLPTMKGNFEQNPFQITMGKARPYVRKALEEIYDHRQLLSPNTLAVSFQDSFLSEAHGVNVAINELVANRLDCIIGYANANTVATVARISPFWNKYGKNNVGIPMLSSVPLGIKFDNRLEYPLLTRISAPYKMLGIALNAFLKEMNSARIAYIFQQHPSADGYPSECYLAMQAIMEKNQQPHMMMEQQQNVFMFSELDKEWITEKLRQASKTSNVIVLCASSDEIMHAILSSAYDLNMTSDEFVFISIDLGLYNASFSNDTNEKFPLQSQISFGNHEENATAAKKESYQPLMRISKRLQPCVDYQQQPFVKKHSENCSNEYENTFVSAIYDAILLYAIAVNESLAQGLNPRNGRLITSKMKNREFKGNTGNTCIDQNGDRLSDYSIFDYDTNTQSFLEVAYYSMTAKKVFHLADFRWPKEGKIRTNNTGSFFDNLFECSSSTGMHLYIIPIVFVAILMIILLIGYCIYNQYQAAKPKADSKKIKWEQVCKKEELEF